jgi:hypothetical protein
MLELMIRSRREKMDVVRGVIKMYVVVELHSVPAWKE